MNIKYLEFGNVVKFRDGTICLIHPVMNYNSMNCGQNVVRYLKSLPRDTVYFRDIETGELKSNLSDYDDDLNNLTSISDRDVMEIYEDYNMQNILWNIEDEEEEE